MIQINIFDYLYPPFKIKTPIRLIELFAGVGSQAMALRDIGADFEHYTWRDETSQLLQDAGFEDASKYLDAAWEL